MHFARKIFANRRSLILLSTVLWALSAQAGAPVCEEPATQRAPSSVTPANGIVVVPADPDLHAESLRASGYTVQSTPHLGGSAPDPWRDPSPTLRNRLFSQAGLKPYVKTWDQLSLDQLFLRAQNYSLVKLATKYRKLPKANLASLQNAILREKP